MACTRMSNAYDEYPYRSAPVEWSAPERLALVSMLHGGPRTPLREPRVLELGCGNGANLLALAYYRRDARFVGVDSSRAALENAEARRKQLALDNVALVLADVTDAHFELEGMFDFILAHGIFSWISDRARAALLSFSAQRLHESGLLYLNYNTLPGWSIRGLVRDFLRARIERSGPLSQAAERARALAGQMAAAFGVAPEHPYSKLMEREFRFVIEGDPSWVAHEYLAEENRAFWRTEFLALAHGHGLAYVADADFDRASGRVVPELAQQIADADLGGSRLEDAVDLVSYRQLHSPILARTGFEVRAPTTAELDALYVAAAFDRCEARADEPFMLRHRSGFEVAVKDESLQHALTELRTIWPRGRPIHSLLGRANPLVSDLRLLHSHGLVELRLVEPDADAADGRNLLNELELEWGGYMTSPHHVPHWP